MSESRSSGESRSSYSTSSESRSSGESRSSYSTPSESRSSGESRSSYNTPSESRSSGKSKTTRKKKTAKTGTPDESKQPFIEYITPSSAVEKKVVEDIILSENPVVQDDQQKYNALADIDKLIEQLSGDLPKNTNTTRYNNAIKKRQKTLDDLRNLKAQLEEDKALKNFEQETDEAEKAIKLIKQRTGLGNSRRKK